MRIVYCLDHLNVIGGVERVTILKANELSRVPGNEVFIVLANNQNRDVPFELSPSVHLIDLKIDYSKYWNPRMPAIYNNLKYQFKKKDHKIKLTKQIEEISPDIVISTGGSEKHMLASIKNRRWKLIREIHGERNFFVKESRSFSQKTSRRLLRFYDEQFFLKKSDRVVVLTDADRKISWSRWKNVIAIPNPVSFKCDEVSALTEKKVVTIGRLDHMKNVSSLINVFKEVSTRHPEWKLEVYGDGPEMKSLQDQSSQMGLRDVVLMKGFTDDVQSVLKGSSIFAFTSLSEGFGIALIEAMECGLPVVSYNCPYGPSEIITDGEDGYLIPLNDERLMADRICDLIENEELRKTMGQRAKVKAQSFQIEPIIDRWMKLFEELLQEK